MGVESFRIAAPTSGQYIILILLAVVIGVAFIIASRRFGAASRRKGKAAASGWHNFYQIARVRGLSKGEADVLKGLVIANGLSKPNLVFTSTNILDSCIQRAVRKLGLQEMKGESKEDLINSYYRLRNKISRNREIRNITTTKAIPVGAKLSVNLPNNGTFSVTVNRNEDDYLGINIPMIPPGKVIPWNKQKLNCSYWKENDASYDFETKVQDVLVTDEAQSLCLKHTDKISRVQKRTYPRKNVRLPVFFSRVKILVQDGKKKAIVDNKDSHWGTIVDISVGGIAVETAVPIDKNNYVRVQFELKEDYKIVAYGIVKRIERNPMRKMYLMHVKFTKMDKKYKNEIFAILYDYSTI